jgi:hypothetical protein
LEDAKTFVLEVVKTALAEYSADVATDVRALLDDVSQQIRSLRDGDDKTINVSGFIPHRPRFAGQG